MNTVRKPPTSTILGPRRHACELHNSDRTNTRMVADGRLPAMRCEGMPNKPLAVPAWAIQEKGLAALFSDDPEKAE
jgi:hypothetical protein